ncbi:MAG: ornithine cyclodeaminase family protein, partial [Actinomycetota bacterium]
GVKVVNSHPRNPGQGLPAVVGTYILASQETGMPLAILAATYLTALRTGAASAVATRYLARADAMTVGLVGAGVQAQFQLEAMAEVMNRISRTLVWAPAFDRQRRDRLIRELRTEFPGVEIRGVEEATQAASAEVICTTTPSTAPIIPDEALSPGTHINAVGADGPGKQELDPATLRRARVVVDEWVQARHGGEINVPLARGEITEAGIVGSLSDVIAGEVPGRTSDEEITIFDSTGLALEDVAVASLAYRRAREKGIGRYLEW